MKHINPSTRPYVTHQPSPRPQLTLLRHHPVHSLDVLVNSPLMQDQQGRGAIITRTLGPSGLLSICELDLPPWPCRNLYPLVALQPTGLRTSAGVMDGSSMNFGSPMNASMRQQTVASGMPHAAQQADVHHLILSFVKSKGQSSVSGCTIGEVALALAAQNISEQRVR